MMTKTPNYKVFTDNKTFVKVGSTYAGKPVWGIAKCAPVDTFDYDYGYRLAKARCDVKVAKKRHDRACKKTMNMHMAMDETERLYENACKYNYDSMIALDNATDLLNNVYNEKRNS